MALNKPRNPPPNLTVGDSAVAALRASQTVLQQRHFDPFPQSPGVRNLAMLLNRLPPDIRIGLADLVSMSVARCFDTFSKIDPNAAAKWVTDGYPAERYPGCILGAPGLAAVFLSGLTGFPFLPQPLLFNARRDMKLDDAQAYLDAGLELAEPLIEKHPDIEATIHYDPVHDRFLIKRMVFVRLKFLTLPPAYKDFVERRLIPGAPVILLDCGFQWLRAEVSRRIFFQLGGLGGFAPQDFVDEIQVLREYRVDWGASSDSSWGIDKPYSFGPESEWGSTGAFIEDAEEWCRKSDHRPLRVSHDDPGDLSRLVFNLYRKCRQGSKPPTDVYLAVFTHTEPRFPLVTGCLPLWLPFITHDSRDLAQEILSSWRGTSSTGPEGSVYVTLHPSFCSPPDLVSIQAWRNLLSGFFKEIHFLGVDEGRYPSDLGSYVAMYPAAVAASKRAAYPGTPFRRPTVSELEEIFVTRS